MVEGQLENNEIRIESAKEQSYAHKLQNVLSSKRFQVTANAYRIWDMAERHSINLYSSFPDSHDRIKTGRIIKGREWNKDEIEAMRNSPELPPPDGYPKNIPSKIRLDQKQIEDLIAVTKEGRDLVSNAKLFTCDQDYARFRDNQMLFQSGHTIGEDQMPLSVPTTVSRQQLQKFLKGEVSAASMRGLFIEMGGAFFGTYILLLDPGRSRWLYDWYSLQGQKDRFTQRIVLALKSDDQCQWGRWIRDSDSRTDLKLAIANHDYKIESVIPLK